MRARPVTGQREDVSLDPRRTKFRSHEFEQNVIASQTVEQMNQKRILFRKTSPLVGDVLP